VPHPFLESILAQITDHIALVYSRVRLRTILYIMFCFRDYKDTRTKIQIVFSIRYHVILTTVVSIKVFISN
jgi:hypothetical protein